MLAAGVRRGEPLPPIDTSGRVGSPTARYQGRADHPRAVIRAIDTSRADGPRSAVRRLLDAGTVVIAVGGGGIPVVADESGDLRGVPAVIDKDLASALLASEIGADLFVISTAVEKVALEFGTPRQRWVDHLTLAEAEHYLAEGRHFAAGSMGPKIEAVISYLERGGKEALITDPDNLERALAGQTGTRITRD
jgi:carbamate kinase